MEWFVTVDLLVTFAFGVLFAAYVSRRFDRIERGQAELARKVAEDTAYDRADWLRETCQDAVAFAEQLSRRLELENGKDKKLSAQDRRDNARAYVRRQALVVGIDYTPELQTAAEQLLEAVLGRSRNP